jgi:phage terminase large subunit-like protein
MTNAATLRRWASDPAEFREDVRIEDGVRFGDVMEPWQETDFEATDPGWMKIAGHDVDAPFFRRAWLERPRGHSKTSDLATMVTWALAFAQRTIRGVACGADRDQAALLVNAIERLLRENPVLDAILDVRQQPPRVVNNRNGSVLEIVASDVATSWGHLCDFFVLDEVCHHRNRGLFDSLVSAAAKKPNALVIAISNAGFMEEWSWTVRETVRADPAWYFSRLDGSVASWITTETLDEQRRLLPTAVYARLWENQWSTGSGDALAGDVVDRAIVLDGPSTERVGGWRYVAGLDLGVRRDASALVVLGVNTGHTRIRHQPRTLPSSLRAAVEAGLAPPPRGETVEERVEGSGAVRLVYVRAWTPTAGREVDLQSVEDEVRRVADLFRVKTLGYDPWQARHLAQRLGKVGIPMREVVFGGANLQTMASELIEGFNEAGRIELYEDRDLIRDLKKLRIVDRSYGFKLDAPRDGTGHGDRGTAFSIALMQARLLRNAIPRRIRDEDSILTDGASELPVGPTSYCGFSDW